MLHGVFGPQYKGDNKVNEHVALPSDLLAKLNESISGENKGEKSLHWAMHQKCEDMFILSKWNGTVYDQSEVEYDFGTDYGICCWFTPQLNMTEIKSQFKIKSHNSKDHANSSLRMGQMDIHGNWFKNIKKGAASGKHNGYKLLFDTECFDYNYYDEGAEGIKVVCYFEYLYSIFFEILS